MYNFFQTEGASLPLFQKFLSIAPEEDRGKSVSGEPLSITFENVFFRYPGSKQDVLRGLSFSFRQGDHIALVGLNGSGKTTAIKLLMKMYEPTSGRIFVNGVDLKYIKPSAWRQALSVLYAKRSII